MSKQHAATAQSNRGNPEDKIRDAILRHLFTAHGSAKSPSKAAVGIRNLHSALKASHGYKQQEVGSNLDYLVQKGWVTEVRIARAFTTNRGTTQNSEQIKYKISDVGLDMLQQASLFQKVPVNSGINITNIQGVTVVGDGNVVNTDFTDLSRVMTEIKTAIQSHQTLSSEDKLSTLADIAALQAQLQKPKPNRSVVSALWESIEMAVTAAGFVELVHQASELIAPLLH